MTNIYVSLDLPRSVLTTLRLDPEAFGREMRLAAAVKWYEVGMISQSKPAEVAGISRAEYEAFLSAWEQAYAQMDAQCEGLTERESLLGTYLPDILTGKIDIMTAGKSPCPKS